MVDLSPGFRLKRSGRVPCRKFAIQMFQDPFTHKVTTQKLDFELLQIISETLRVQYPWLDRCHTKICAHETLTLPTARACRRPIGITAGGDTSRCFSRWTPHLFDCMHSYAPNNTVAVWQYVSCVLGKASLRVLGLGLVQAQTDSEGAAVGTNLGPWAQTLG